MVRACSNWAGRKSSRRRAGKDMDLSEITRPDLICEKPATGRRRQGGAGGAGHRCCTGRRDHSFTKDQLEELIRATREEQTLRQEFVEKWQTTANLERSGSSLQMGKWIGGDAAPVAVAPKCRTCWRMYPIPARRTAWSLSCSKPEAEQPKEFTRPSRSSSRPKAAIISLARS